MPRLVSRAIYLEPFPEGAKVSRKARGGGGVDTVECERNRTSGVDFSRVINYVTENRVSRARRRRSTFSRCYSSFFQPPKRLSLRRSATVRPYRISDTPRMLGAFLLISPAIFCVLSNDRRISMAPDSDRNSDPLVYYLLWGERV